MEFFKEEAEHLGKRYKAFSLIFNYLSDLRKPIYILETGCIRRAGNWRDGQSTLLFCKFIKERGGHVESIDINQDNLVTCRNVLEAAGIDKHAYTLTCGDSIKVLKNKPPEYTRSLDLVYLDSFDLNIKKPLPAQKHALAEMQAVEKGLDPYALVAVDDNTPKYGKGFFVKSYLEGREWEQLNSVNDYIWVFKRKAFNSNVLVEKKK